MEKLRQAGTTLPLGEPLSWSRAGDAKSDELSDWTLKLGAAALYKVHTAIVASGPRRSEKIRAQALKAGARTTDIIELLPSESARVAIVKDPHAAPAFELLLSWVYGHSADFQLPTLGAPAKKTAAATDGASEGGGDSVYDMFSMAIFGTPSKATPGKAGGSDTTTPKKQQAANGSSIITGRPLVVKPEQLPLLWQLAGALNVRGLKSRLIPIFETNALPSTFVMEHAAFERLKLLVRALELHAEEIVGALCEQLRLPTATTAVLRDGMSELAVAAAAVDTSRYDALVACGLLPAADARRLAAILDRSSLRVPSEAHVHDLLLTHFKAAKSDATSQESLWATCRFTFLPPDRLVALAERPNVPARWLALACAQRAAASGSGGAQQPVVAPAKTGAAEAARLKPRDFYRK